MHEKTVSIASGVFLSAAVAAIAFFTGRWPELGHYGFGPATVAIFLGVIVGNLSRLAPLITKSHSGINVSKNTILKFAVVLYGFRLSIGDLWAIGPLGFLVDTTVLISTFLLSVFIGVKVLKLGEEESMLIGTGSAICGAAAVMSTAPLLRAKAEHVTVGVGTVVIFGTASIFLFPILHRYGIFEFDDTTFGIYAGSTIHNVTTVAGATTQISPYVAATALTTKLMKVSMLAPFLLTLGFYLHRRDEAETGTSKVEVPWFAVFFLVMVGVNSLQVIPSEIVKWINEIESFSLMTALSGLGLGTDLRMIRRAGIRPLILGLILFLWLVFGGAWIVTILSIAHQIAVWMIGTIRF